MSKTKQLWQTLNEEEQARAEQLEETVEELLEACEGLIASLYNKEKHDMTQPIVAVVKAIKKAKGEA